MAGEDTHRLLPVEPAKIVAILNHRDPVAVPGTETPPKGLHQLAITIGDFRAVLHGATAWQIYANIGHGLRDGDWIPGDALSVMEIDDVLNKLNDWRLAWWYRNEILSAIREAAALCMLGGREPARDYFQAWLVQHPIPRRPLKRWPPE